MSTAELTILLPQIKKKGKLLDVGFNEKNKEILESKGFTYHGIDLKESNDKIKKCNLECDDIPYEKNTFDIILCMCVIEHLGKPIIALKKLYQMLKKEGIIVVTSYDFFRLNNIKSLLINQYQHDFYSLFEKNEYSGHIRTYTKKEITIMLKRIGFTDVKNIKNIQDYLAIVGRK